MSTDWPTLPLRELASLRVGATPRRDVEGNWGGTIPWIGTGSVNFRGIDSSEEFITSDGLESSSAAVMPSGTILLAMFGQGATRGRVARLLIPAAFNQACVAITPRDGIDDSFLYHVLVRRYLHIRRLANLGSQANLNARIVGAIELPVPPIRVQHQIGRLGDAVDLHVERLIALAEATREFKRGVAERLFGEARKQCRTVRLSRCLVELTGRNRLGVGRDRVMGVIKGVGLVPMRERIRVGDLARYKDVPPDAFAFNPMRINIGSIARNTSDKACLVSPDYVVFQTDPDSLLPEYLDQLRHTRLWQNHMDRAGAGGVRIRIYFRDLAEMRVPLPSLEEQRKIANLLSSLDHEIATLERLADAYAKLRSALLDKLLSGEIPIPAS